MGGGLLIDGGIHYLHLLRDWAGPVEDLVALAPAKTFPAEGEDTVFVMLRFRSGAVAALANSIAAPRLPRWQWAGSPVPRGRSGDIAAGPSGCAGAPAPGRVRSCETGADWWPS